MDTQQRHSRVEATTAFDRSFTNETSASPQHGKRWSQRLAATALEMASEPAFVTDAAGAIRLVNRQTEAVFGYSRLELLGQSVHLLIPAWQGAAYQLLWNADGAADQRERADDDLAGFVPGSVSVLGQRRDGHQFPVEVRFARLEQDGEPFMIASVRLAHDERRAQEVNQQQLRRVLAITDTALAHLDLDALLPELLTRVRDVMDASFASIWLLNADGRQLTLRAESHLPPDGPAAAPIPIGMGLAGRVAASRQPLVVDNISRFPLMRPHLRKTTRSALGVPLLTDERLLGVLCVGATQTQRFSQPDVALLEQAAARIAAGIERAQLFEAEQTARYEAERERARWLATMESAPEFVITCDADLRMTYVNPAYARLRGSLADPQVPAEERPSRYGLFLPDGATLFPVEQLPLTRALREGRPVYGVQMALRTSQGEERLVEWQAAPMSTAQGEALGAVAIGHDVTEQRQLERRTRELAAQLQATLNTMDDAVFLYDPSGQVLQLNAAAQALVNDLPAPTGPQDSGLSWRERVQLFHPRRLDGSELPPDERPLARVLSGETLTGAKASDVVMTDALGRDRVLNYSGGPARDEAGRLIGSVFVVRDITERQRAEEARRASEERFRAAFESAAIGVAVVDLTGRPQEVNDYIAKMVGYTQDELRRLPLSDFTHPDDVEANVELLRRARDGEIDRYQLEKRYLHKDGHVVWGMTSAAVVRDHAGQPAYLVAYVEDITQRKQLEREREEARAAALAEHEANAQMDVFLSLVSHELKQPLTVMSMRIQLGGRRLGRLVTMPSALSHSELAAQLAPIQEDLIRASQQVDYEDGLINDLLDATRVRTGKLAITPEPANLIPLVESAVDEQRLLTPKRVIQLDLPAAESIPVHVDGRRIKQVVTNYLTNALKYSPATYPVEVGVTADDTLARVWVRDQGPGLTPDQQQRIFERFYRAPGIKVQSGVGIGLGLGLYICQSIIEQHDGQVGVESAPGQGSVFWFTIPLAGTSSSSP
jgi:PAS domain S-box-containing protein